MGHNSGTAVHNIRCISLDLQGVFQPDCGMLISLIFDEIDMNYRGRNSMHKICVAGLYTRIHENLKPIAPCLFE